MGREARVRRNIKEIIDWDLEESKQQDESQLDRVEKKVDRILELLEDKDSSTSVVLDNEAVARAVISKVNELQKINRRQ